MSGLENLAGDVGGLIGVGIEASVMMRVMQMMNNNMTNTMPYGVEKPKPVAKAKEAAPVPRPFPPLQPKEKKKPVEIVNWWDTDKMDEHYKKIAKLYGF